MDVVIGIDPHKHSYTAVAVDGRGEPLGELRVAASRTGRRALLRWSASWPSRRFAVENASGAGRVIAQEFARCGEPVLDVPAKLAARVRLLSTGHNRKSDRVDARSVALAAITPRQLHTVAIEDGRTSLRLLTERREDLVAERTRRCNRLHVLLCELLPNPPARNLSAERAGALLRGCRPQTGVGLVRRALAVELVADLRRLDRSIRSVEIRICAAVQESGTTLLELFGVGPVLGATFLGEVGDVRRFATRARFAAYSGTAPIEASSGEVVRHRLSRAGNRRLNHALHLMAIVQIRHDTAGRTYYRRKLAEGKSRREALRCLKRRLSDVVYRQLLADAQGVENLAA